MFLSKLKNVRINRNYCQNKKKFFSEIYDKVYNDSIHPFKRENFWADEAKEIQWDKSYEKVLDNSNIPFYRWYTGGKTNMSANCIDRHIQSGMGSEKALIWESAYLDKSKVITFNELYDQVSKLADVLLTLGVRTGDRVIIYMPMIPEATYAMLACSRIGAIHSVIFGGFGSEEIKERLKDCRPKLIVTANIGLEPKKKIPYYPIITEALDMAKMKDVPVLYVKREEFESEKFSQHFPTFCYRDLIKKAKNADYISVDSNQPLYILYTSGTTGTPKGIVRDTAGTIVALNYSMKYIYGVNKQDTYFATSDIGWVVGHSYIVYGPLIRGAATIMYEGKPVGTPNPGKYWEIIDKHKVTSMFTSPTALRAIKKEDFHCSEMIKHNLSSLRTLHIAGERCDSETFRWIEKSVGNKVLVNDNWWQTETGWPICSNNVGIETFVTRPGAAGKPVPGYEIKIIDEHDESEIDVARNLGKIYIKLPLPPSFMLTLWGNDQSFKDKYITKDNKYYISGDAGFFDENGFIHIMTRIDDIINVAGHRLSTGRIEEVINSVPDVVESAVIAARDDIKGESPFAFIVCRSEVKEEMFDKIKENVNKEIVHSIGPISKLKGSIVVNKLPKNR